MSYFSDRLTEIINLNHYSQTFVAAKLHTTQQTISNWMNGVYEPSLGQLVILCKLLDVTPNDLLGFSDFS